MARRRVKKSVVLVGAIILFFIVYFASFMHFSKKESSGEDNSVKIQAQEDNRSLLKQLASKEKIYLSDQVVSDVQTKRFHHSLHSAHQKHPQN